MQARRAWLAELVEPEPLEALAGHPGLVVADPAGAAAPDLAPPTGGEWLVIVGPEGGFDPSERQSARPRAPAGRRPTRATGRDRARSP